MICVAQPSRDEIETIRYECRSVNVLSASVFVCAQCSLTVAKFRRCFIGERIQFACCDALSTFNAVQGEKIHPANQHTIQMQSGKLKGIYLVGLFETKNHAKNNSLFLSFTLSNELNL